MQVMKSTIIVAAGLLVSSCGLTERTPPSNFYILSPVETSSGTSLGTSLGPKRQIIVLIGPVILPKHLDRAELVTFTTPNRLQLAELDRWAEPLDENIARVLGENVSRLVPTDGVAMYSGAGRSLLYDHQLIVEFPRLELSVDGEVHITALWRLHDRDGRQSSPTRRFEYEEATDPAPEAMAAAVSSALGRLGQDIAVAVRGAPSAINARLPP